MRIFTILLLALIFLSSNGYYQWKRYHFTNKKLPTLKPVKKLKTEHDVFVAKIRKSERMRRFIDDLRDKKYF